MAVYTLTDRATTRTTSRWGSCMHSDRHTVGDADLFNDQVGKIGKYRHKLILAQEMVVLEILFCPLFYHMYHHRACGRTILCFISTLAYYSSQAVLIPRCFSSSY